jgi:hydrogenase maturation protease
MSRPRILIAGIGNIFLGDDAFGVEVVRRLALRALPEEVRVADFGIRSFDLAYALMEPYDLAILIDAVPRGGQPGTLYVIEPTADESAEPAPAMMEAHGLNPATVLNLVRSLGGKLPPLRLVGCEPTALASEDEMAMGLSEPVQSAVDEAVRTVEELIAEMVRVEHA